MAEQRDHELLERFRAEQDAASLECLIRRHADFVFGVCSRVLRNRHDAEDAFQATFLILVSRPPRLRRRSSLTGWLFRVAHRTSMRVARQRRRLVELDDLMAPVPEPFEEIYKQEAVLALDEELSTLPERYRAPLVLCSLLGKSRSEAASELGRSEASVKASLTRGKHLLRTRLLRRGILLSIAAAAGKQLIPTPVCASDQLVQLTSSLCQGGSVAPGAGAQPSPDIQSLANAGVREMTSVFSTKLAATVAAVTVVAGGILVANIETPKPAGAAAPLGTTVLEAGDEDLLAYGPDDASDDTFETPVPAEAAPTLNRFQPGQDDFVAQPELAPMTFDAYADQPVPSQQLMPQRAEEHEQDRDETLIDIKYQRRMADVMEMKAQAKRAEAQAMEATGEERDTLMNRSHQVFATAESREYEAEAERLAAQADLLERRLTASGAPSQEVQGAADGGKIEAGDKLWIRMEPDPEGIWGRRELTVSAEGNVTLPYVGEIRASGLTVSEFGDQLVKYYKAGHVFENPSFMITHHRTARSQQMIPEPELSNPEPTLPRTQTDPNSPTPEPAPSGTAAPEPLRDNSST